MLTGYGMYKGRGQNIDERDFNDATPLMYAMSRKESVVYPPVHDRKNAEVVKLLIERGADVKAVDKDGNSALMFACENGFQEGLKIVIDNDGEVNRHNNEGETPLMRAAEKHSVECVKLLLEKGASIFERNTQGADVFDYAAAGANDEVMRLLTEHRDKIRKQDKKWYQFWK
jgi:ankyrin repeat protein